MTPPAGVALVTGAGRGIGRGLAEGLAAQGLAVGLLGRAPAALDDAVAACERAGARASAAVADVTDLAAVRAAVRSVEAALGPVDLLVNNAGLIEAEEVPVWEADPAQWRAVVETDLIGPFHCVRAVVPGMVARGAGRVVDINSGTGLRDTAVYSAYAAAKLGLVRLGGAVHAAGAAHGVLAFEVAPGVVRTDMTGGMRGHSDRTDWTPLAAVVDLVAAIARGELDAWSGRFLRAGTDDPAGLARRAAHGLPATARTVGLLPYGADDPLA